MESMEYRTSYDIRNSPTVQNRLYSGPPNAVIHVRLDTLAGEDKIFPHRKGPAYPTPYSIRGHHSHEAQRWLIKLGDTSGFKLSRENGFALQGDPDEIRSQLKQYYLDHFGTFQSRGAFWYDSDGHRTLIRSKYGMLGVIVNWFIPFPPAWARHERMYYNDLIGNQPSDPDRAAEQFADIYTRFMTAPAEDIWGFGIFPDSECLLCAKEGWHCDNLSGGRALTHTGDITQLAELLAFLKEMNLDYTPTHVDCNNLIIAITTEVGNIRSFFAYRQTSYTHQADTETENGNI